MERELELAAPAEQGGAGLRMRAGGGGAAGGGEPWGGLGVRVGGGSRAWLASAAELRVGRASGDDARDGIAPLSGRVEVRVHASAAGPRAAVGAELEGRASMEAAPEPAVTAPAGRSAS
jgi:hypothetical protein